LRQRAKRNICDGLQLDYFSEKVNMTISGESELGTTPGCICSWIWMVLTALYVSTLVDRLMNRLDPDEAVTVVFDYFNHLDTVDLAGEGFKIAFGVMDLYTHESLEDPDFVTYEVNLDRFTNLLIEERIPIPFHKCTEEDFATFYGVRRSDKNMFKKLKDKGVLNCMDIDQELVIRGGDEVDSIILNIDYVRCDKKSGGKC
jgi:hypothetical protein